MTSKSSNVCAAKPKSEMSTPPGREEPSRTLTRGMSPLELLGNRHRHLDSETPVARCPVLHRLDECLNRVDQRSLGAAVVEVLRRRERADLLHLPLDFFLLADAQLDGHILEWDTNSSGHGQEMRPVVPKLRIRAHLRTARDAATMNLFADPLANPKVPRRKQVLVVDEKNGASS